MVPRLPPAVPPLLPPFPPIPGWVMSWKEGIFSLCSVGPSHRLSVSSESRKPLRALACSCHVTPPAKENVNSRSCSETPSVATTKLWVQTTGPSPPSLLPKPLCLYRGRLPGKRSLCCGLKHDNLDFLEMINKVAQVFFLLTLKRCSLKYIKAPITNPNRCFSFVVLNLA